MDVFFREANTKDVAGIIALCNECFDENTSFEYAYKAFNNTKDDVNNIYLVGILDNKIIAHTKVTIIPTMYEEMNTYAIINHFCVKPEYRRHNIATKLLNKTVEICKNANVKSIKLWSNNYRLPAHSCYKKYGFMLNDAGFFSKDI